MSFFDVFASLCAKKGVSPSAAADEMGFSRSTVTAWKQGKTEPSLSIMQKMADYFGVSLEYLTGGKEDSSRLTIKDHRDIARDLEKFMGELSQSGSLMFDGNPLSDEAKESIIAAMKLGSESEFCCSPQPHRTPRRYFP